MASLAVQLAVLAALDQPRPASEVAQRLDVAEIEVEEAVGGLEETGLVEREGFGAKTRLVPTTPRLPELAANVRSALPGDAWRAVFARERAELAYLLAEVGRLELAAFVLDEPVERIRVDAYELAEANIFTGTDPYELTSAAPGLAELLAEIDALRARRWAQDVDPDARILWHLGPEVLFATEGSVGHPEVTYGGPSLFDDHGQDLDVQGTVYHRTRRELDASDAILQTLIACPNDEAARQACRGAYRAEPTPTFREKARIYGLEDEADQLADEAEDG